MDIIALLIGTLVGLAVGSLIMFAVLNGALKKRREAVLKEAELEGETLKKEKIDPGEGEVPAAEG